jgi:hypothetical protein
LKSNSRLFGLLLLLGATPLHAQTLLISQTTTPNKTPSAPASSTSDVVTPDRPGYTNGSEVVPVGRVQIEVGLARTRASSATGGANTTDAPEVLARTGLTDTLELRLTLPNYLWPTGSHGGFSDGAIGVRDKFYQSKDGNTKFAFTPTLSVPVKSAVTISGHLDPNFLLSGQTTSGPRWGISANLILSYPTQNGRRLTDYTATSQVTYALSGPLSVFGDVYEDAPAGSAPSAITDGGFTYMIAKNAQLDLETGRGIGGAALTQFYGGGLALRF